MKIKAIEIAELPAGSVIRINGVDWIRMKDSYDTEDGVFNPKNGDWAPWSHLFNFHDEVELISKGESK